MLWEQANPRPDPPSTKHERAPDRLLMATPHQPLATTPPDPIIKVRFVRPVARGNGRRRMWQVS